MASTHKCLHEGCGKLFIPPPSEQDKCTYHPGPPVFHEGQKGWKCCKPRVLTFDEFLTIPPCTTGIHSALDDTPVPEPSIDGPSPTPTATALPSPQPLSFKPQPSQSKSPTTQGKGPEPESDSDDPDLTIPPSTTCRRRGCGVKSPGKPVTASGRADEKCTHHPGHPIFHEGQKGWQCCKPRVLSFDEFLEIAGCVTKPRHLFIGKPGSRAVRETEPTKERQGISGIRQDFYQTPTTLTLSLYVKGVRKEAEASSVTFEDDAMTVHLVTAAGDVLEERVELAGAIDASKSAARILGTKVEITLHKRRLGGWPVLRRGETRPDGQILQVGGAGRA